MSFNLFSFFFFFKLPHFQPVVDSSRGDLSFVTRPFRKEFSFRISNASENTDGDSENI